MRYIIAYITIIMSLHFSIYTVSFSGARIVKQVEKHSRLGLVKVAGIIRKYPITCGLAAAVTSYLCGRAIRNYCSKRIKKLEDTLAPCYRTVKPTLPLDIHCGGWRDAQITRHATTTQNLNLDVGGWGRTLVKNMLTRLQSHIKEGSFPEFLSKDFAISVPMPDATSSSFRIVLQVDLNADQIMPIISRSKCVFCSQDTTHRMLDQNSTTTIFAPNASDGLPKEGTHLFIVPRKHINTCRDHVHPDNFEVLSDQLRVAQYIGEQLNGNPQAFTLTVPYPRKGKPYCCHGCMLFSSDVELRDTSKLHRQLKGKE